MSSPMWNTGSINTVRPEGRRATAPLALFAICFVGVTSGQVNTEALRRSEKETGQPPSALITEVAAHQHDLANLGVQFQKYRTG